MNSTTYNALPDDLKAAGNIEIDNSIPAGVVELRPSGVRIPTDDFIAQLRKAKKCERQNRRQGRMQAKKSGK